MQQAPIDRERPLGFTVLRVPFFLEPEYPTEERFEETNRTRLHRKWGGEAAFKAQKQRHGLKERGEDVGITHFNLDRIASNTLASHRLVQWVTRTMGINAAETLYNDLNYRHFEKGQKLNDRAMLVEAAGAVGADRSDAETFLASNAGEAEIEKVKGLLSALGVNSIPTFVVGGKRLVSGAAHSADLVYAFRQIEESGEDASRAVFAEALGIPQDVLMQTLEL